VDTRGGVAGVFDGAFRIFFDDSLRGSLVFFAGCRSRFEGENPFASLVPRFFLYV
jgi:hypothetical protein